MGFEQKYAFGQKVYIDGDQSIVGYVLGFQFYPRGNFIEVGWMHGGDSRTAWFDDFRLSPARS